MPHLKNFQTVFLTCPNYTDTTIDRHFCTVNMCLSYGTIKAFFAEKMHYLGYSRSPYLLSSAEVDVFHT